MKICARCELEKELSAYSLVRGKPYSYCRSCKAEDDRAYRSKNIERVLARAKKYRAANKESVQRKTAEWHARNRTRLRQIKAKWKKRNPDCARANEAVRRGRIRQAEGTHSMRDIKELFVSQAGKCAICVVELQPGYHVDHVVPLARGGSNWKRNLQILCPPCNESKGARVL